MSDSMQVKVSILTVFYNRYELVKESMESLLNQSANHFEIIAIDDGSTDNTYKELSKFDTYDNVRIVRLENGGFVNAIRHAVDIAKGEYIAIHGSGDISHVERIKVQAKYLDEKRNIGLVACKSRFEVVGTDTSYIQGEVFEGDYSLKFLNKNYFHHGEVMFRKSLYNKVGGYRILFKFAQDIDLWCRMSSHADFSLLDKVLYTRYVNQPNSVSEDPAKTQLQRKLAQFAVHCHEMRLNNKGDPLDKDGIYALIDFKPKGLGYVYFKQAIRQTISENLVSAQLFLDWSIKERYFPSYFLCLLLKYLPGFTVKLLKFLLSLITKNK